MITLDRLNRKEAIRYLGGAGISLNYRLDVLMDECEKEILKTAEPRFLYVERKEPFDDILLGNDIKKHLDFSRCLEYKGKKSIFIITLQSNRFHFRIFQYHL